MPAPALEPIDRLSAVLERFHVSARLFHTGPLCGVSQFDAQPGRGFLHVLRKGEMTVTQRGVGRMQRRIEVREPTLLFYPNPLAHQFHNAPKDGSDFTCASVHFEGGENHPLVRALPPLLVIPLCAVEGLNTALDLLFAEADQVRCGQRLLADRLFEVVLIQLLRWLLDHPQEGGIAIGLMTGLADAALARTLTALHEQPGAAWNLEKMALQAGLSRSAFAARFKALVGATPADYLADWRMTLAMQQLVQGQSVKCIADTLGYANASALSRVFAQRLGVSPRAWLASARVSGH
jgi:AraC-like DNA-binding protein